MFCQLINVLFPDFLNVMLFTSSFTPQGRWRYLWDKVLICSSWTQLQDKSSYLESLCHVEKAGSLIRHNELQKENRYVLWQPFINQCGNSPIRKCSIGQSLSLSQLQCKSHCISGFMVNGSDTRLWEVMLVGSHTAVEWLHQFLSYQGSYLTKRLYTLFQFHVHLQIIQLSKTLHSDDAPLQISND